MAIRNILWPFDIIYGRLVQFVVICYIFPNLVYLEQEKSGNPGKKPRNAILLRENDFMCKYVYTCFSLLT
jgi:hypothetical protein